MRSLFGITLLLVLATVSFSHPPIEPDNIGPNDTWNTNYCNSNFDLSQEYRNGTISWKNKWTIKHAEAVQAIKNAQNAYSMRQRKQPPMYQENITYYNQKMTAANDWFNQSSNKNYIALSRLYVGDYNIAEGVDWEAEYYYYNAGCCYKYSYSSILEENNEDGPFPWASLGWAQGIDFCNNAISCANAAIGACQ